MRENTASEKKLKDIVLMLICCLMLTGGCSLGKEVESPKLQSKDKIASSIGNKQNTKPEKATTPGEERKSETEYQKTVMENNGKELEIEQKSTADSANLQKASKDAEGAAESEQKDLPVAVSCVISGKNYNDIFPNMPLIDVLNKVAGRIPQFKRYTESTNSKYHCKKNGKLLPDQGCEILWEFELRPAGGYDPDKYYLVRIKETDGRILAIEGSLGWEEPFPSALPEAAGVVQESAPYDLLRLK